MSNVRSVNIWEKSKICSTPPLNAKLWLPFVQRWQHRRPKLHQSNHTNIDFSVWLDISGSWTELSWSHECISDASVCRNDTLHKIHLMEPPIRNVIRFGPVLVLWKRRHKITEWMIILINWIQHILSFAQDCQRDLNFFSSFWSTLSGWSFFEL